MDEDDDEEDDDEEDDDEEDDDDEDEDSDEEKDNKKKKDDKKKAASKKEDKGQKLDGVPEEFIGPLIAELVAHEVGHTLGLRHNFKASSVYSMEEITSKESKGTPHAGSVMDYLPINMRIKDGKIQGEHTMIGIGPYDMWAIEYAYTQFPDVTKPEDELDALGRIAERGTQDGHAFGSHEDMGDPRTNMWDIGADSVEYYDDRIALARAHGAMIETAREWESPRLPVRGADVVALGVERGPAVSRLLAAVEAWWEAGDYRASRTETLKKLGELVKAVSAG